MHIHIHKARRLSLALLTTALATSLLAACSNTHEQATPPPTSTSTTEEPTPTETIDRQARLEALSNTYEGYLKAMAKGTNMSHLEGLALMRNWADPNELGRTNALFANYRKRDSYMIHPPKFTAYLAPNATSIYACMDLKISKAKNKLTGIEEPAYDVDQDARRVDFKKSDTGKWLVFLIVSEEQEAGKQCNM